MPKKQTKPKYPKELLIEHVSAANSEDGAPFFAAYDSVDDEELGYVEVAIYQFVRMAKVKRTVTVE